MNKKNIYAKIILAFFAFFILLIFCNVLYLMITGKTFISGQNIRDYAKTSASSKVTETIQAKRGTIYSSDNQVLASDVKKYNIYAILSKSRVSSKGEKMYVYDKQKTAKVLSKYISLSYEKILNKLNTNSYQVEFGTSGKNLTPLVKEAIEKEKLPGIEFTEVNSRNYPFGDFASFEIGYASVLEDIDPNVIKGQMGIEKSYDSYLAGTNGERTYLTDNNKNVLPNGIISEKKAVDGNDVYLTINSHLQNELDSEFTSMIKKTKAKLATVAIMEAKTGRILAISNYPSFDVNKRNFKSYNDNFLNTAVEPGSVFKAFVFANALSDQVIKPSQTYMSGTFNYKVANGIIQTIHDYNRVGWGRITFADGLMHSSNTAITTILTKYANYDSIVQDYKDLGLFQSSKIDGLYSGGGINGFSEKGKKSLEYLTTGFGQGSTVTALQLLRGYSVFANDGKTVEPYLVDKVVSPTNQKIYTGKSVYSKKIFTSSSIKEMRYLLYRVINNPSGTGRVYKSEDVEIIGKTGTGQIAENGGYSSSSYTHSFVGLAPYDDPTVELVLWFQGGETGTKYAGELVQTMFKSTLNILNGRSKEVKSTKYKLSNYVNQSTNYASKMLQNNGISPLIIGNGKSIKAQYPEAYTTVSSSSRVMLLTNGDTIEMPSLIGYSRKDVMAFASLANVDIKIDGSGLVTSQSVSKGTKLKKNMKITVKTD